MLLELEDILFTWPGASRPVLDISAFAMEDGEKVFLYGPSGSGKSTLLALIGGLIAPDQGRIVCKQQTLNTLSRRGRDRFRAAELGVIFQQFNLLPWLDLENNVALPCRFSRQRAERAGNVKQEARRLLAAMDLPQADWTRRADGLSVGQQQRVAAARALIGQPALILADEPTSALDTDRRNGFLDLLFNQVDQAGSGLLFVSHDQGLADRFDRQVDLRAINQAEALS